MADILIRGMEMPKEYGRCVVIFPDGRVTTEFGTQVIATAIPIVPPHGRLIDADSLEKELAFDYAYAAAKVCHNAPTIVPAEGGNDDGSKL